jgi:ZIP family zinc transporter
LGGLFAIRFRDKLHLILGFSAGAMLGVALFDLLPESIELIKGSFDIQLATIMIAIGFSSYMLLDRLFSIHKHDDSECEKVSHKGKLSNLALVLHSGLDGLGIGLAFRVSPAVGWVVAAAVLTHDFSDGINTVGLALKRKGKKNSVYRWLIADALAPAIGVAIAYVISVPSSALGLILSIFVGLFLYISATDLIPESHHHHPTVWTTVSTLIGLIVIFAAVHFAG